MPTYLDQIMSRTLLSVARPKGRSLACQLERRASAISHEALPRASGTAATKGPAVIAELQEGVAVDGPAARGLSAGDDRDGV